MSETEGSAKTAAMKLLERREDLQAELNTQYAILDANNCTMKTGLVDAEGFPRADIDVYNVRLARVRIIEIGNDLKAITDDMAKALEGVHESQLLSLNTGERERLSGERNVKTRREASRRVGFSCVASVSAHSPAEEAGLRAGDIVIEFGGLGVDSFMNGVWQTPVSRLVTSQENQAIPVLVRREGEEEDIEIRLIPRTGWGGRGLLGCHLVGV